MPCQSQLLSSRLSIYLHTSSSTSSARSAFRSVVYALTRLMLSRIGIRCSGSNAAHPIINVGLQRAVNSRRDLGVGRPVRRSGRVEAAPQVHPEHLLIQQACDVADLADGPGGLPGADGGIDLGGAVEGVVVDDGVDVGFDVDADFVAEAGDGRHEVEEVVLDA
ncbi:hypothetical protein V493_03929 [Pseudogymnoascus sp. VKM F-4281 (FW-2241)]|nr:hypothetical protein V493_03929 [Pseudogymnoascus sp. VKM F-4281 (FW-2241)]